MRVLVVVVCALAALAAVNAACDNNNALHARHNWMTALGANFHAKKLNEVLLLGSHDAGCVHGAGHARPLGNTAPWEWAVTQTQSIEHQLCAGYRVFDLRFRKAGATSNDWRIFHGSYEFQTMQQISGQIHTFCNDANRQFETIILRIKTEGASKNESVQFMVDFNNALGDCGIDRGGNAGQDIFATQTIASLGALNKGSQVKPAAKVAAPTFIMPYGDTEKFDKHNEWVRIRYPYYKNMFGKSSESLKVTKVTKGQQKKLNKEWAVGSPEMFGWWMTMTGGVGHLNVDINSGKLYDAGKYGHWINTFIRDKHAANARVGGLVIWTDWAGDNRLASVSNIAHVVNTNIAGGAAINTNVPAAANGQALVYSFVEEGEEVNRVAFRRSLAARVGLKGTEVCPDTELPEEAADAPIDAKCIQSHIIPMDLFDECDDADDGLSDDEIDKIMKDTTNNMCALCLPNETKPIAEEAECHPGPKLTALRAKLKCCAVPGAPAAAQGAAAPPPKKF